MNKERWQFHMVNLAAHLESTQEVDYPEGTKLQEIFCDALAWLDNIANTGHLSVTRMKIGTKYVHAGGGRWERQIYRSQTEAPQ